MTIVILDACAMIAYLKGEPGDSVVESALMDPETVCFAHAINLLEVFYEFLRVSNSVTANRALRRLHEAGVASRRDIGAQFIRSVGALKARGGLSLADCFCIALAQATGGEVYTSDHHEFDRLVPTGICPILFIR